MARLTTTLLPLAAILLIILFSGKFNFHDSRYILYIDFNNTLIDEWN